MGGYEEPAARVGITQILATVTAMEATLAVVAGDVRGLRESTRDLDARMDALEGDRWPWRRIGGMAAVAALAVSIIFGLLTLGRQDNAPAHPPPPPRPAST